MTTATPVPAAPLPTLLSVARIVGVESLRDLDVDHNDVDSRIQMGHEVITAGLETDDRLGLLGLRRAGQHIHAGWAWIDDGAQYGEPVAIPEEVTDLEGWAEQTAQEAADLSTGSADADHEIRWKYNLTIQVIDEDGDLAEITASGEALDEPPIAHRCPEGDDHEWEAPHHLVGGLEENPGVHGSNNGGIVMLQVCRKCGTYRHTDTGATESATGATTTRTTYQEPDDRSRAWVASLTDEDDEG